MRNDDYATCSCVFLTATKKAILIAHDDEEHWIPRSLLSYNSDKSFDNTDLKRGSEVEITLRAWKALEIGLEF